MRKNTIITVAASALFGLLAVYLAKGWIDDAVETEFERTSVGLPTVKRAAPTVPVVTLREDVHFGDRLAPDLLKVVQYPEGVMPEGSFASIDDVFPDPSQPTLALTHVASREILLAHKISGPGGRGSLSAIISDGMRATAIRVNDVSGVGGFIVPGDHVDVLYARDETLFTPNETRRSEGLQLKSVVLLQNVKILGIDQNLNDASDTPSLAKTATVEVSHEEAQKLQLAQATGTLSLALRRRGETLQVAANVLSSDGLTSGLSQETVRRATPVRRSRPARSNSAEITVVRGEKRDAVTVFKDDAPRALVLNGAGQ